MIDAVDEKILNLIEEGTISGESLAEYLGVTRTAVWKRINKLKKLGYTIETSSNGYRLVERTELLLENEIKPFLKTSFIGKKYIFFQEIGSTNSYAKQQVFDDGAVVVAQRQKTGRGRRGRKWISTGKGLYFSIVLKPKIPLNELLRFSLIFPLSILDTLSAYGIPANIKWPNDVYLNEKKLSGILIESDTEGEVANRVIVGIGINVNDTKEEFREISGTATSLFIETGRLYNKKEFLSDILYSIENRYVHFLTGDRDSLLKEVESKLLWKGEEVKLLDDEKEITGILLGLNSYGGVRINTGKKTVNIFSGDISLRKTG